MIVQPLVVWLWIGGVVMALGTVLAAFPGPAPQPDRPRVGPTAERAAVGGDGNGSGGRDRSGDGAEVAVTGRTAARG